MHWLDHTDYSTQHLNDLHREAEQERLANKLPHRAGLLETALKLLTGKRDDE